MKKITLSLALAILSTGLATINASACTKYVDNPNWKDSSNIPSLPLSEVVCVDNGFDNLITKGVFDDNFEPSILGIGRISGILTLWSEDGSVKALVYGNTSTKITGALGMETGSHFINSELDVKVGNSIFKSQIDPQNNSYQLPPEALKALSEAYITKVPVTIRLLPSGIISPIGDFTIISLGALYINYSDNSPDQRWKGFLENALKYGY